MWTVKIFKLKGKIRAELNLNFIELNMGEDAPGDVIGGYDYFTCVMKTNDVHVDEIPEAEGKFIVLEGTTTWTKNGEPFGTFRHMIKLLPEHLAHQFQMLGEGWTDLLWGSMLPPNPTVDEVW